MIGEVHDLHAESHVWLVHSESVHHFVPGETGKRCGDLLSADLHDGGGEHLLDGVENIVAVPKGAFEIELGELELAVGSGVLVPVAASDLKVPFYSRDHQKLLEELRRLWEGVELALAVT
jgi:hypothetical protein